MLNRLEAARRLGITVREFNRYERARCIQNHEWSSNGRGYHKMWSIEEIEKVRMRILADRQIRRGI